MDLTQFVENTLLLYIRHITWTYGCYQMFRYSNFKLNYGPFFVFSNLEIVVRLVIGQKIDKIITDDLVIQLLIGLLFFYAYLIRSKQYSQIVYQSTIIINLSWYIRQYSNEDMLLAHLFLQYLFHITPLYQLYRAIQNNDQEYISNWYITFYLLESLITIIHISFIDTHKLSPFPSILKILIAFSLIIARKQIRIKTKKTD